MASLISEHRVSVPLLRTSWLTLTFIHWRVRPKRVQALLPPGLVVDEYDGAAWVGLTPFIMADMRPLGVPALPGRLSLPGFGKRLGLAEISSTLETNLRTYVRGPDGRDGVWFLTIDVASPVLAAGLRTIVGAPYHAAQMSVDDDGDVVTYTGSRTTGPEEYRLRIQPGQEKEPSDFDIWLTGRWRAYTTHIGRLLVTPVDHEPWPLREASIVSLDQNLTRCVGLGDITESPVAHYSAGVHKVRLGGPTLVPRP